MTSHDCSPEPQQYQEAYSDEGAEYDTVPSLLAPNSLHQAIDARYLCCSSRNPPLNADQALPLQTEALIDSIRLAEHTVGHVVGAIQPVSFLQHVLGLLSFRVLGDSIGGDVLADIGE